MAFSDAIKTVSEPVNKLLVPVSSAIGSTLQDAWELVFGGFGAYVEKKRAIRAKDIEDFKASLVQAITDIPVEHQTEPSLAIVGPALEASKYYFEEKTIRDMFVRLIAASADDRKNSATLTCFTEIIKQLSPLDAQNLSLFSASINSALPVAQYVARRKSDGGNAVAFTHAFLENTQFGDTTDNLEIQAMSLSHLEQLGLVSIRYDSYLVDQSDKYKKYLSTEFYRKLEASYSQDENISTEVINGFASLTPLGVAFRRICLSDE